VRLRQRGIHRALVPGQRAVTLDLHDQVLDAKTVTSSA
jgi:hypothetical protein